MQKKETIELGITVFLIIVMVLLFGNAAKKPRPRHVAKVVSNAENLQTLLPDQLDQETSSKDLYNFLEKQIPLIELKRDPFNLASIIIEKDKQSGLVLSGILWDKNRPMAIIEGEVIEKGERIGNKTVIEIKQDRVIFSDGEVLSEIKLQR